MIVIFILISALCTGFFLHHKRIVRPMAMGLMDCIRCVERFLRNCGYMQLKSKTKKKKGGKAWRRESRSSEASEDGELEEATATV